MKKIAQGAEAKIILKKFLKILFQIKI